MAKKIPSFRLSERLSESLTSVFYLVMWVWNKTIVLKQIVFFF